MNRMINIGLSAFSGITLGLLWAYANSDKTKDDNTQITQDKKVKKIQNDHFEDSFNTTSKNHVKNPSVGSHKHSNKEVAKPVIIKNKKKQSPIQQWSSHLNKQYTTTQLSISNTSTAEKNINLWGGNAGLSVSPPTPSDVEDHTITHQVTIPKAIGVGIHPQGIAINPVNGFAYVANQLSNNVSVINTDGQVVTVIPLQPSIFPGYNSPVAIAVNTKTDSASYGKIYVVGSVANTVSVIDLSHQLTNQIAVGVRPVAIAFNPVNEKLYVSNLVDNTISVIDTAAETLITKLAVGQDPLGVAVNPVNGDVFVANSGDNTISVFDHEDTPVTTIIEAGKMPTALIHHPLNQHIYVAATNSNTILPIDTELYTISDVIDVGAHPYQMLFNTTNNFLYVGNRSDNTYTIITSDNKIRATVALGNVNIGMGIHQEENLLFSSDTATNTINVIGYQNQSSSIIIDDDFQQKREDFQHCPVTVKHMKVISSTDKPFKLLTLQQKTISGSSISKTLSLNNYNSPQHFVNAYEVFDMDGAVIDGRNSWNFTIAAKQSISLLIYYKQLKAFHPLPKNTSKSFKVKGSNALIENPKKHIKKTTLPISEENIFITNTKTPTSWEN